MEPSIEGAMRSGEFVEALPGSKLCLEIDAILVGEELAKLLLVRAMQTFDLAVEQR